MTTNAFATDSTTLPLARHLALLAFGITIAVAAWPPATDFSWVAGGRSFSANFTVSRMVAEVKAGTPNGARSVVRRFLPAGIVLDHPERGASFLRLSVPSSVGVGVIGVLWVALLVVAGPRQTSDDGIRGTGVGGAGARPRGGRALAVFTGELGRRVGYLWALRWTAGAACVAGAWLCVYTLPSGVAGTPYTDAQALHVTGAALSVFLSTILIAFD